MKQDILVQIIDSDEKISEWRMSIPHRTRQETQRPTAEKDQSTVNETRSIAVSSDRNDWSYQCLFDHRIKDGRTEYLVEWTPIWKDVDSITDLDAAIREYEELKRRLDDKIDIISDDDKDKSDNSLSSGYISDESISIHEDESDSEYEFLQRYDWPEISQFWQ